MHRPQESIMCIEAGILGDVWTSPPAIRKFETFFHLSLLHHLDRYPTYFYAFRSNASLITYILSFCSIYWSDTMRPQEIIVTWAADCIDVTHRQTAPKLARWFVGQPAAIEFPLSTRTWILALLLNDRGSQYGDRREVAHDVGDNSHHRMGAHRTPPPTLQETTTV